MGWTTTRFQFRLKTLLLVVTAAAFAMLWYRDHLRIGQLERQMESSQRPTTRADIPDGMRLATVLPVRPQGAARLRPDDRVDVFVGQLQRRRRVLKDVSVWSIQQTSTTGTPSVTLLVNAQQAATLATIPGKGSIVELQDAMSAQGR